MLESYKENQEVAYSLFVNSVKKDKLSHAYLINANNYDGCYDFVKAVIKFIVCAYFWSKPKNIVESITNKAPPPIPIPASIPDIIEININILFYQIIYSKTCYNYSRY